MKAAEQYREYTSRHTSTEDGDARHARKATASSSVEGSLPSSLKVAQTLVCYVSGWVITVETTD